MKFKLLHDDKELKTYAIVFDKGDDVREGLLELANTTAWPMLTSPASAHSVR